MKPSKLSETYPELAKDWDYSRNKVFTPNDVSPCSKKNVWWACESGHKYQVSIHSRVRSNGCKACQKHKYVAKQLKTKLANSQSLAEHSPELLKEWDYTKNTGINPDNLSYGSNKRIWWKCSEGHEWKVSPKGRTKGTNCPVCAIKNNADIRRVTAVKKAGQSFSEAYPKQLAEWDFEKNELSPDEIAPKSNYRASWVCQYGHKWEATVSNRTNNHSNCPECNPQSSRIEIYMLCEIRSIFPNTKWRSLHGGVECDIYIPEIKLGIEVDGQYWHDKKLKKDQAKNEYFKKRGIQVVRVRDDSLPEIDCEQINFDRTEPLQGVANRLMGLLVSINNVFQDYAGTQQREDDFKEMIARLPAPPESEALTSTHPDIVDQWDYKRNAPLTPDLFSKGSNQKFWWKCKSGHHWEAAINNRVFRKSGCPKCYLAGHSEKMRRLKLKKTQSLAQINPIYLGWYDYDKNDLHPSEIAIRGGIETWWRCNRGHSFMKKPCYMAVNHQCPMCNTLSVKSPEVAAQWNYKKNQGLLPEDFSVGSGSKVWWQCEKGHEWKAGIVYRTHGDKTGCPFCYNENRGNIYRAKAARRNGTLADLNPEYLFEWDYTKNTAISPDGVTSKSCLKVWWRCYKGHLYEQSIASKARGSKCPECMRVVRAENVRLSRLRKSGSLQDHFPDIANHWYSHKNGDLTPNTITTGSKQKIWWRCDNDHEWEATVNTMTDKRRSFICPVCKNRKDE